MLKKRVALLALAALTTSSFAVTNIKAVDWGSGPPDGYADVKVVPSEIDLTNPLANVTYLGVLWGTRPGILQFDVKRGGETSYTRTYVLCVELEQGNHNAVYGSKALEGYAGFLANQIGDIVANPDPGHIKSAALSLATWELDYDGYDPVTHTVNLANLDLSSGKVQYLRTGESLADYVAIRSQAGKYIAELRALDPAKMASWGGYTYLASDTSQDYITGVPGPIAAAPFLIGLLLGLRRGRRKVRR